MKKTVTLILVGLDLFVLAAFYWIYLPALNIWSLTFWFFVMLALMLALMTLAILSSFDLKKNGNACL